MKITERISQQENLRALTEEEKKLGERVYKECFALQPTESVLVLADKNKMDVAAVLFEAAKQFSSAVDCIAFKGMTENAQEPSEEMIQEMMRHNISLLVTSYSLSHTRGRHRASDTGVRIASLPGITIEMMERTLSADYDQIAVRSDKIAELLSNKKEIILTSLAGTTLSFSAQGRLAIADTGKLDQLGSFGNLPAGEAFLAPVEGTTQGTLVIDGSLAGITPDMPITIEIVNGKAIKISGGKAAEKFEAAMREVGEKAFVVAELGVGTNEKARVQSDILEAEKALGTCHVAFGDNASFGGTNDVQFHSDGLVLKPTLVCDGQSIIRGGRHLT